MTRQYCGQLGKQDNCQVAVTLSVANRAASLPIAYRLYLPEEWAGDSTGRDQAGVPEAIAFGTTPEIALATTPEIALAQVEAAVGADVPQGFY